MHPKSPILCVKNTITGTKSSSDTGIKLVNKTPEVERLYFLPPVVVAAPEARLIHTVLHEIPPDSSIPWDITQERPGYFIQADIAFRDLQADDYAGVFISGGRAPEYIRYDQDLNRVIHEMNAAEKPIASVCHGVEILTSAGILQDRKVTTVAKCAMDAEQGGGIYVDQETVVDGNLISARTWHDNAPLMKKFLEMLASAGA
jgi:protease I